MEKSNYTTAVEELVSTLKDFIAGTQKEIEYLSRKLIMYSLVKEDEAFQKIKDDVGLEIEPEDIENYKRKISELESRIESANLAVTRVIERHPALF